MIGLEKQVKRLKKGGIMDKLEKIKRKLETDVLEKIGFRIARLALSNSSEEIDREVSFLASQFVDWLLNDSPNEEGGE